jgi:hypothetical protein
MGKVEAAPDPTRSDEREALEAAKDDGFKPEVKTFYEIRNYHGERKYFSDDKADAETRLKEMAAGRYGIGGAGEREPALTLHEVRAIEVEGFDPDGPESRTRGKRSGKVDSNDPDAVAAEG